MEDRSVVVIVLDSLARDLLLHGMDNGFAPSFDSFRRRGLFFPYAVSSSATTTPSFVGMLTGNYAIRFGVRTVRDRVPGRLPFITELLERFGYHTWAEVTGPLMGEDWRSRFREYRYHKESEEGVWFRELLDRVGDVSKPFFGVIHFWGLHIPRYYRGKRLLDYILYSDGKQYLKALEHLDSVVGELVDRLEDSLVFITGDHGDKVVMSWLKSQVVNLYRALKKVPVVSSRFQGLVEGLGFIGHGYKALPEAGKTSIFFIGDKAGVPDRLVSNIDIPSTIVEYLRPGLNKCLGLKGLPLGLEGSRDDRVLYTFSCSVHDRNKCRITVWKDVDREETYFVDNVGLYRDRIGLLDHVGREHVAVASYRLRFNLCLRRLVG
ncbi:MAG: sulfatase-like hydrolase/transferase [Desulfurococcales archaeon]|nr:sulfatase-like hydrolase/transferase [Desulfurococcales archaeon]